MLDERLSARKKWVGSRVRNPIQELVVRAGPVRIGALVVAQHLKCGVIDRYCVDGNRIWQSHVRV